MTVLLIIGLILLFFIVPYLTGNIYGVVLRKKGTGVVGTYLAGMAIVYGMLTILQFVVVKFKLDFLETSRMYHILFVACIVLGIVCLGIRWFKDKAVRWDVELNKKSLWIFGLIFLQGILYVVLKNPYFENNALLETARVTLETGTIYEYNAFTGLKAQAGFPLSNKLMFLPVLYAYIGDISGVDLTILFNFVMPTVTFISFYAVMVLWMQRVAKESGKKWELLLLLLVWIVQVGDGFEYSTAFRVLHSGYTGEAIFFGIMAAYALYSIKNRCYVIALVCGMTFPGLVKYDAILDFAKSFDEFWNEAALSGGMVLVYIVAVVFYIVKNKKVAAELFNLNLIIAYSVAEVWEKVVAGENGKVKKVLQGGVVLLTLLMCGNIWIVSDDTAWRSNPYGVGKAEYELLQKLDDENKKVIKVAACDELVCWIKRLGIDIEPVVGYDLGGKGVWWYSYENYDENHTDLWRSINYAMGDMEQELMLLSDQIDMDYVVVRRITEKIPIVNNEEIQCVYDTPSYLVYLVDKK